MNLPRRSLLTWIAGYLAVAFAVLASVHAQDQTPQVAQAPSGQNVPRYTSPYQMMDDVASAMQPGDKASVRAAVEAIFKLGQMYPMPDLMAAVVKQRVIDAQMAYLDGKTVGVVDGAVVDAINGLATAFDAPDYARVSVLQVQFIRSGITESMPIFMRSSPDTNLDEPDPPMSPLQALLVMGLLIDQKLINPQYQAAPAEWDRDYYPRLVEQMRARQELQRRIAAGEVPPPKNTGRLVVGDPKELELERQVRQRIIAMSVTDGLKLFNETFARLGIQ